MSKERKTYPPAVLQRLVEMFRAGRPAESLARDFEPTAQTIRNWVAQSDRVSVPVVKVRKTPI
jgi:transposase